MLRFSVSIHLLLARAADQARQRLLADDRGQSTAEYALVLLGAAAVALLMVAWAGKTDKIGKLLNGVVDEIIGKAT